MYRFLRGPHSSMIIYHLTDSLSVWNINEVPGEKVIPLLKG